MSTLSRIAVQEGNFKHQYPGWMDDGSTNYWSEVRTMICDSRPDHEGC